MVHGQFGYNAYQTKPDCVCVERPLHSDNHYYFIIIYFYVTY